MPFRRAFVPRAHHANRRRSTFSLTRQRYMLPLLLLAALAAVLVHLLIMRAAPWLYEVLGVRLEQANVPQRVEDEEVRVVVRERPHEELPDTQLDTQPQEPTEIEEIAHEDVEIDLLDVDVQDLVMAPGETNLPLPAPEQEIKADSSPIDELAPRELDMAALGSAALSEQAQLIPEPTPINTNSVVVNADAQTKVLEDAEGLIESELRRQAKDGSNQLPSDTRSLADLMGASHLSASSGVARLGTDLLFRFNESKLQNSARISLLQLAALIHKNPSTRFIIEGHTDGIGTADYNNRLSLQRAAAVCNWLRENGVPIKNVYMRACGSSKPLVDIRAPREKQALNRRVEIHMRSASEDLPSGSLPATTHKVEPLKKPAAPPQPKKGAKAKPKAGAKSPKR